MEFGTITGREIAKNKDAERKTLLLQVRATDDDDVQTVELHAAPGDDVEPPDGARVFYLEVSKSFGVAVVVDDGIEPEADLAPGEREIYSSDGGSRKAKIRWKKDGTLVLNDGTESAVKGDTFKTNFEAHTHTTAFGPSGPPVLPLDPTNFNDTVKL